MRNAIIYPAGKLSLTTNVSTRNKVMKAVAKPYEVKRL
jgi:hypothetical protein